MKQIPLLTIQLSHLIPKRREVLLDVVGNAFASALPFHAMPVIDDKTRSHILFHFVGLLPGPLFHTRGRMDFVDDGLKTRVQATLDVRGMLISIYALSWLALLGLWLIQTLWGFLFSQSLVSPLVESWVAVVFLFWPFGLFLIIRRRMVHRIHAFLRNLVFHS